ncbi:MAG: SDR family oxidoreductase [Pseudodesulfovibrio sp.]
MNNDLKVAVITGGGKGMGADIARVFHEAGYGVVVGSRSDSGLAGELGANARFVQADVRSLDDHRKLVAAAGDMGVFSAYVNNAGFSRWQPLQGVDEDFWDAMIDTNLKGVYWGCKAAAEGFVGGGVVVNVSSLAGKRGSANNSVYCASKFGVNGITQALAKELGPRGIRVNAVCPVYVKTEGVLDALLDARSPTGGRPVESYFEDFIRGNSALGRLPEGREIGELCLFLASQRASAITGQCINIDCGVMPQ